MAAAIESPAQFERDLRSAHKGWKRDRDSTAKWAHGHRPLAGIKWCHWTGEVENQVPEHMLSKSRPIKKTDAIVYDHGKKKNTNCVKSHRPRHERSTGRPAGRLGAQGEIEETASSRSIIDLLVPAARKEGGGVGGGASWGLHSIDGVLYSFDATDTPSRPVTLEAFVKANNRTTEKLVEKEYEILDVNGDLLKGRKARNDLRRSASGIGGEDDEDFELV